MDTNQTTTESSPLLRLSPELRNLIYEYALTVQKERAHLHALTKPKDGANLLALQPGLTRSCRKIRQESLMLYYTLNSFHLTVPLNSARNISTRLERASLSRARTKLAAITKLEVTYYLSSVENTPDHGGGRGGWLMIGVALARLGFKKDQVEWKGINGGHRFSHPSRGGNYYVYLAEEARCKGLEGMIVEDWEKTVLTFGTNTAPKASTPA